MKLKILTFVFFSLLLDGCNYTIDGTYYFKKKGARDSLFILKNNIFYQHFVNEGNKSFYNKGTWDYKNEYIEFNDFVWYQPGYGPNDMRKVFWLASYNMTLAGGVYINVDPDLDYDYARIKRDIPKYVTAMESSDTTIKNKK